MIESPQPCSYFLIQTTPDKLYLYEDLIEELKKDASVVVNTGCGNIHVYYLEEPYQLPENIIPEDVILAMNSGPSDSRVYNIITFSRYLAKEETWQV